MHLLLLAMAILFMGFNLEYKNNSILNSFLAKFSTPAPQKIKKCKIALITIDQQILKAKPFVQALRQISLDKTIKGLILHVNSGGGKIGTCELIFHELKKISSAIPAITVVENTCASGAYFIACATNHIIAPSSSEIGSIGVIQSIIKYSDVRFQEKNFSGKSKTYVVAAGKHKDRLNPNTAIENADLKYLQERLLEFYHIFVEHAAASRNLSKNDHLLWADGQLFVAKKALALGLIDSIGDFSDGLKKIKELISQKSGIPVQDDDIEIVDIPVQTC